MITKFAHRLLVITGLLLTLGSCKKDSVGTPGYKGYTPTVYVLGSQNGVATYWKAGLPMPLSSTTNPNSFFVSGSDLYTIGTIGNFGIDSSSAEYSINGLVTTITDSNYISKATAIFVSGNDVYVAGDKWTPFSYTSPYTTPTAYYPEFGSHAIYWKNGLVATLPSFNSLGGDSGFYCHTYNDYVNSIFVSGNNVYVAGGSQFITAHAEYWENGVLSVLSNGGNPSDNYATTTSIFASGSDIYITGYEADSATGEVYAIYWKDGIYNSFYSDSIIGSSANGICVSGSDVYIVGYGNIKGYSTALIWKNGVLTKLFDSTEASAVATSIAVYGNDVYVGGYSWNLSGEYAATYWKDGVATNLSDGKTVSAVVNAIFVQ
jgi:hypothetical protein